MPPLAVHVAAPPNRAALEALAEGLTGMNFQFILAARRRGVRVPTIYASGVRYRREAPRQERWQTVAELLRTLEGDCEDLAAWRAAELRADGELARVAVVRTPRGSFHAVVRHQDGTIEDPSLVVLAKERKARR